MMPITPSYKHVVADVYDGIPTQMDMLDPCLVLTENLVLIFQFKKTRQNYNVDINIFSCVWILFLF